MKLYQFALLLVSLSHVLSQDLHLVANMNDRFSDDRNSNPKNFIQFNEKTFFGAVNGNSGIWQTDLTEEGTILFQDDMSFHPVGIINNLLLFNNLMATDGTSSGTVQLAETEPINKSINFHDLYIFITQSGLWRTDGSQAGTFLLSALEGFTPFGVFDGWLFLGRSEAYGVWDFWKTDGTVDGTQFVSQLECQEPKYITSLPGRILFEIDRELWSMTGDLSQVDVLHDYSSYYLSNNGLLYFTAYNDEFGSEPWITDGTPQNTSILKDLASGPIGSDPGHFFQINGHTFFFANTNSGFFLFMSDGTEAGTVEIVELPVSYVEAVKTASDTEAYFTGRGPNGQSLAITDGTETGTRIIQEFPEVYPPTKLSNIEPTSSGCFFSINANELWFTDRTQEGTQRLKALHPDPNNNPIGDFYIVDGTTLLFRGYTPTTGFELWTSDGSTPGTRLLKNIAPPRDQDFFYYQKEVLNGGLYLSSVNPRPIVQTFGTPESTHIFGDLAIVHSIEDGNGHLLFGGENWNDEGVVYSLDPLTNNYSQLTNVPSYWSSFGMITCTSGVYMRFYSTPDHRYANSWYFTDGTEVGTRFLGHQYPVSYCTVLGDSLICLDENQLFSSGIAGLGQLTPNIGDLIIETPLTHLGDYLFFNASESRTGREPWVTDGTPEGTFMLADLSPGVADSACDKFAGWKDKYLFVNNEKELWITDLTPAGTTMITQIDRTAGNRFIKGIFPGNNHVFLHIFDQDSAETELWLSKGTETSTYKIKDLEGHFGNDLEALAIGDRLYFQGDSAAHGRELWFSDGSIAGTSLHTDLEPGPRSSSPRDFTQVGGQLFLFAKTDHYGAEWWRLCVQPDIEISAPDELCIDQGDYQASIPDLGPLVTYSWSLNNGTVTDGQGTRQIEFEPHSTGDLTLNVVIEGLESCLNQSSRTLSVIEQPLILTGSMLGPQAVCAWEQGVTYSITPDPSAMGYQWTVPEGATIQSGQGTHEISVAFGGFEGIISVQAMNGCGLGPPLQLSTAFYASSALAEAGFDQDLCDSQTMLEGNSIVGVDGVWQILSGLGGSLVDPYNPETQFHGIPGERYHLRWSLDLSPCPPSYDDVFIQMNEPGSNAIAGDDISVCDYRATLSASYPSNGYGMWSCDDPDLWIYDPYNATTSVQDNSLIQSKHFTLRWTVFSGACDPTWDDIQVDFFNSPSPVEEMPNHFILNGESVNMEGQPVEVGDLSWSITSGPSQSLSQFEDPLDLKTLFTPMGGSGYYECQLENSNGVCEPLAETAWVKSGTVYDTPVQLSNYYQDPYGSISGPRFILNDYIWFFDSAGFWRHRGTPDSLDLVRGNMQGAYPFLKSGDLYFFRAKGYQDGHETGWELGVTDGTIEGTRIIDINPGSNDSSPNQLIEFDGKVFFTLGIYGDKQLWVSDGTQGGTYMVKDVVSSGYGRILNLFPSGSVMFFSANDGINGTELWKTDGTEEGTIMVKDINPDNSSQPDSFCAVGDILYFSAYSSQEGVELWRSDGTEAGTWLVKDLRLGISSGSPENLFSFNGKLYFSAQDDSSTHRLWQSDGTTEGTVIFFDHEATGAPVFFGFDRFFFGFYDGEYSLAYTDGTIMGTEVMPELTSSASFRFVQKNEIVFFSGTLNETEGLCRMDLSLENPIAELLAPVEGIASLWHYESIGDNHYLAMGDSITGSEIWKTDGTVNGTNLVVDLRPTEGISSNPNKFLEFAGNLFFLADQATNDRERWRICAEPSTRITVPEDLCFHQQVLSLSVPEAGFEAEYQWEVTGAQVLSGLNQPSIDLLRNGLSEIQVSVTIEVLGGCHATGSILIQASQGHLERWQNPNQYLPEADADQNGSINVIDFILRMSQCSL